LGLCRRTCYRNIGSRVAISPPELNLRFNRLQEFKSPRLRQINLKHFGLLTALGSTFFMSRYVNIRER